MNSENKVLLMAISGLESGNYKESLEKIMMEVTGASKRKSYERAVRMRIKQTGITIDDINMKHFKAKYGYFKNYTVIELALDRLQMTSETFFEIYQFEYNLKDNVEKEVKELIERNLLERRMLSMYNLPDVSFFKKLEADLLHD